MTKGQFYLHTLADHWQEMGYPYAADLLRHHANEGVPAFREIVGGSPQVSERAPQGGGPVIFGTPDLGGGHNQAKLTFYHVHPDGQQQRLGSVGFTRPEGHAVMRTLQAAGHKGAEIDAARTLPEGWKAPKAHQSFLPTLNTARPEAPEQDWRPNEMLPEDFYGYSRKRLARAKARHDGRKAARNLLFRRLARLARGAGLRPGEPTEDGGHFEPEREPPDLGEYIANKFKGDYGDPEPGIGYSTGFLLSDGRGVPMGPGERYEDHRAAIPTTGAMRRWGWPEEIARGAEQGTRTPALFELMRRAGAVRVHASRGDLVLHLASPLTGRQAAAIRSHVESHRPHSVVVEVQGGGDAQLDRPDPEDVMHAIARAMRPRPRRNGRPYRAPAGGTVVRKYSHRAFGEQMRAEPGNGTHPLVWADYLQEQGHDEAADVVRRHVAIAGRLNGPYRALAHTRAMAMGLNRPWEPFADARQSGYTLPSGEPAWGVYVGQAFPDGTHPHVSTHHAFILTSPAEAAQLLAGMARSGLHGAEESLGRVRSLQPDGPQRMGRPYRAPAGGTVVRGVYYEGGSMIPDLAGPFATGQTPSRPAPPPKSRKINWAAALRRWTGRQRNR